MSIGKVVTEQEGMVMRARKSAILTAVKHSDDFGGIFFSQSFEKELEVSFDEGVALW